MTSIIEVEVKFVWQISHTPANGASLSSYLVKTDFFDQENSFI